MRWLALALLVACGSSRSSQPDGTGGPAVAVTTVWYGATPETVEQAVLLPLEQSLARIPNVETVRSVARADQGQVVLWFKPGSDPSDSAMQVSEAMRGAGPLLPRDVVQPVVTIGDPDAPPDLEYVATSSVLSIGEASDLLARQVANALLTQAGVRRVQVLGARPLELQVLIDAERVRITGITHDEVIHAIANGEPSTVEQISNLEVAQLSHVPVLVKDVASVNLTSAPAATDEPLGLGIWLQKPHQRAAVEQALHEILRTNVPRTVELTAAPPRPPRPTLAIELTGQDLIELAALSDSLTSDLADIATLTREPRTPKAGQPLLVVDPAAQSNLHVTTQAVRAISRALAREPLRSVGPGGAAIIIDLGSSPLDGVLLRGSDGAAIPLSMIATLETQPATPVVHVDLMRAVVLTVDLKAGGTAGDVQRLLDKHPRISHHSKEQKPRARLVTRKRPQ